MPETRTVLRLSGWMIVVVLVFFTGTALFADDPPPPCPDSDGDGYVACVGGCDSTDKLCGDCDDGDALIYHGVDCAICNGPGCPASFCVAQSTGLPCPAAAAGNLDDTNGYCLTGSLTSQGFGLSCDDSGGNVSCAAPPDVVIFEAEGGDATDAARRVNPTCSDAENNDCDGFAGPSDPGFIDLGDPDCQTAEFCDGLDNDGDTDIDETFNVDAPCNAGIGDCNNGGVFKCDAAGTGTICNAVPSAPDQEGPFGSFSCSDGIDNDCDGTTDFPADASCTTDETCDGLDNDGDGDVDEDFAVGTPCFAGQSDCRTEGQEICSVDGSGTVCNALAAQPGVEGPANPTSCGDGLDNDCDGAVDGDDPSCGAVGLNVTCALPFHTPTNRGRGRVGRDCNSWHRIDYDVPAEFGAEVTAELLGLGLDGSVLAALPVDNGDITHMASRIDPDDLHFFTEVTGSGEVRHKMFAPIPMLRVTADDGVRQATAYCSTIPYLQVFEPMGGVVAVNKSATMTASDAVPVRAALPLVDISTLEVLVDGVDLFEELGVMPENCDPLTPCSGSILIGGMPVGVVDLIVDAATDVPTTLPFGEPSSNSLSMTLTGLGCGGHLVRVSGDMREGARPRRVSRSCHVDDLADHAAAFTFEIDITAPAPLQTGVPVPTPVTGTVCHGLPIEGVNLNGMEIFDAAELTVTPGDGVNTLDTYEFPIDEALGQTNLARDLIGGDAPFGTFDPGTNFVQAAAADSQGNRVFNSSVAFSTGETALPGVGALSASSSAPLALQEGLDQALREELESALLEVVEGAALEAAGSTVTVENAFVVGLTADSIQNFFSTKCAVRACIGGANEGDTCSSDAECGGGTCQSITERFEQVAKDKIEGKTFGPYSAPFPCSCDPSVPLTVTNVAFTGDLACPIFFPTESDLAGDIVPDGRFRVFMGLPDITVSVAGSDSCRDTFLGICIAKASASISLDVAVTDIRLRFDVTEDQLMGSAGPAPTFDAGVSTNVDGSLSVHTSVGCIGGDICEALVTIFTFGLVDVTPNIDVDRAFEFAEEIGQGKPDPIKLAEIKVDEEEVENFNQTLAGDLVDVNITSEGIRASLTGRFATNFIDPEIVDTPGTLLTPAATPELPFPGATDAAVLIADDTLNMLFASLTLSGRLKSECITSNDPDTGEPRTIGSLLPADCETIGGTNNAAAALAQGLCHGLSAADCETVIGPSITLTALEQGTCHGFLGDQCSMIATGFDGIALPADCDTIGLTAEDSEDPDFNPGRSTLISQGRCHGLQGADCESLTSGGTVQETAFKQGACHGAQGHLCTDDLQVPTTLGAAAQEIGTCGAVQGSCTGLGFLANAQCVISRTQINIQDSILRVAEQTTCNATPAVNVSGSDTILFCARQDVPPTFVIRDDLVPDDPVEVGLRLNDLSLAIVADRNEDVMLDGSLTSIPPCFGEGAVATGDCALAALCLDLNLVASMELASSGECPADGGVAKPGFKAKIEEVQQLSRLFGQVCGGLPAGDDTTLVSEASTDNASTEVIKSNAEDFAPPACINGLTLGGFVSFDSPKLIAVKTGPKPGDPPRPSVCSNDVTRTCTSSADCVGGADCIELQDYLGVTTTINPNP